MIVYVILKPISVTNETGLTDMNTYTQWNKLIADYVTDVFNGTPVYLSLDNADIETIGHSNTHRAPVGSNWAEDFRAAVRQQVVNLNGALDLEGIRGLDQNRIPWCLGYLVATVLAANRMKESEDADASNYFTRLREVLNLPTDAGGRPKGMAAGAEESLWQEWGRWLRRQGFQPTARAGEGTKKYIQYPISQALLRDHDRNRLYRLFESKQWNTPWDPDTLVSFVRAESSKLPSHLRKLLSERGSRYQPTIEAIHQTYLDWLTYGSEERVKRAIPYLYAELYREEDPISEEINYYLRSRKSRATSDQSLSVEIGRDSHQIRSDQTGLFYPVIPISFSEITTGGQYTIKGSHTLKQLILPQKDFWILVFSDSEGSQISGRTPELGELFMLLCRRELEKDLELLEQEQLIKWKSMDPILEEGRSEWLEIQQCMVVSADWKGVHPQSKALRDALIPRQKLSIHLSGGLKDPNESGWLLGYEPELKIVSFSSSAMIKVTYLEKSNSSLQDKLIYYSAKTKTQEPFKIKWEGAGDYLIETSLEDQESIAEKMIKIIDWKDLKIKAIHYHDSLAQL